MTAATPIAPGPPLATPFPRRHGEHHEAYCERLLGAARLASPPRNYVLSWAACVAYLDAGRPERSADLAHDVTRAAEDAEARAWALRMQAEITLRTHSASAAAPLYEEAQRAFEAAGDVRNALAMRVVLGVTRSAFDGSEDAAARRRLELGELTALLRANDPLFVGYDRIRVLNAIGILHLSLGDLLQALAFFEASDALKGPPAPVTIRRGQLNRALVLVRVGDTESARALLEEALEAAPRSSQTLAWRAYNLLGLCHLGAGRTREARAALDEARRVCPGELPKDGLLNEAKLRTLVGDPEGALELLGPIEDVPSPMAGYEWMLEIARARLAHGDLDGAHDALDRLSRCTPGRYFLAATAVLRGELAIAEGELDAARRSLEVAEELAEAAGSLAVLDDVRAARARLTPEDAAAPRLDRRTWLESFHARVRGVVASLAPSSDGMPGANAKQRADHLRHVAERFAHDVASPLTAATHTLDQLSETLGTAAPDDLLADLRAAITKIHGRREHALLELQSEGPTSPDCELVDLRNLTAELWREAQAVGARKDILVELRVLGMPSVRSDRDGIREIVENLLSNALKYSSPGTTVTLRLVPTAEGVEISVRDQGPGLSPEDVTRVFDRFVRLPPKPTGSESSHGLGLHVARRIAYLLGGSLDAESQLGRGSTFTLALPFESPRRPSRHPNPLIGVSELPDLTPPKLPS
ncbi:MAG: ATP-binding protein [Myxococcota bacterium]